MVAMALLLALSLVVGGCAAGVSQGEYDSVVAEQDAAQTEIASLEAEIEDLNAQIEALTTATLAEEAWDRSQQRHMTVMQNIPFLDELVELAPWVEFPNKPAWLDSAQVCSAVLVDEPPAYEAVCLITLPDQQMFVRLSDYNGVTSMICQGGDLDYEITVTQDENGNITEEMIKAGESWSVLSWTEKEGEEIFTANVDGEVFEVLWSDEPDEFADFCSEFVGWLETINKAGGLITPSDQPLVILALGEMSKPPRAEFVVNWGGVARRAVSDLCCGVPQTCLL